MDEPDDELILRVRAGRLGRGVMDPVRAHIGRSQMIGTRGRGLRERIVRSS
jgi:hypothetical protein